MSKVRDELRAAIFAAENRKAKTKPITLFGQKVEIRQPTIAQVTAMANNAAKIPALIQILTQYCFVPGTDEKLFDDADAEAINELPSGPWLNELNKAIEELTGFSVKDAEKNLEKAA